MTNSALTPTIWTSDDPHLSGNFAPIETEVEASDLPVISGNIPEDLRGAYMRNGPNPDFKPISYTYPLDGDGMIHAVYFDNGRARYKNRFVRTRALDVERNAGRAVYGGVMRPIPVEPSLIGPHGEPGPFKNGAFINVLHHGDHLIALGEAEPSYEMTMELDTIGEWKAGTDKPLRLGAHNKIHPTTGALYALAYTPMAPVVTFHHIDPRGTLLRSFPVTLAAPAMIHDFVLTEHYLVLLVGPAVFDTEGPAQGKPFLQWRPDLGTRIAIITLDGSQVTWLESEAFYAYHCGNGFERNGQILIDYVRHAGLNLGYGIASGIPPMLHRMTIDLATGSISDQRLGDFVTEFPRINDRFDALATRFVYVPTLTDTLKLNNPPSATFNTMVKMNCATGDAIRHDFGNRIAGEAVFIPKPGCTGEDDGYLTIFAYDPAANISDLMLLDAAHIDADPVAVIRLPQRVPQGLHGTWIPAR